MPNTFASGYYFMAAWTPTAGTYYPDPYDQSVPPPNSWHATTSKAASVFASGRDAIIRSVNVARLASGTATFKLLDYATATDRIYQAGMSNVAPEHMNGCAIFVAGGFCVSLLNSPTFNIAYQILAPVE